MNSVDELLVEWPDGTFSTQKNVAVNKIVTIKQENTSKKPAVAEQKDRLFTEVISRSGISFLHKESEFVDFRREPLMPHMLSRMGPCMAIGDVNGDGKEDVFAGGGIDQSGNIFTQRTRSSFSRSTLKDNPASQATDAAFFDADGDNDLDIYVANGGNGSEAFNKVYQDQLFLNDGSGRFSLQTDALPDVSISSGCVEPADIDGDGDLDLFVGGRVLPGEYPNSPRKLYSEK